MEYLFGKYPGFRSMANDSDTKLLLHMDGANDSTTIIDSSASGHIVTANGNAKLSTTDEKFGSASARFPGGDTDSISIPDHADWNRSTGTVTIDFWFKIDSLPSSVFGLFDQYVDSGDYVSCYYGGSGFLFRIRSASSTLITLSYFVVLTVDTWYHLAITRGWGGNANDWAMTLNGTAVDTDTVSITWPNLAASLVFGRYTPSPGGNGLIGNMDEARWSNTARWTTDFIVPAGPYQS